MSDGKPSASPSEPRPGECWHLKGHRALAFTHATVLRPEDNIDDTPRVWAEFRRMGFLVTPTAALFAEHFQFCEQHNIPHLPPGGATP